ncbi:hypothetical protein RugamoR64_15420 [Duganella rhizosphaerae]|uniref:hypothetical protein n=1 Tax=Duganella rhizosphaerae TaxID=2885763 RepID=UPI0030E99E6D
MANQKEKLNKLRLSSQQHLKFNIEMTIQSKCFYPFTKQLASRIGQMTSFVWASYAGLWHIHREASAIAGLSAKPEWKKIENYLVDGVPDRGGIDLKFITSKAWPEHQAVYSDFILAQGAVLYEEWCGELARHNVLPPYKINAETFQFPSGSTSRKWTNWAALDLSGAIPTSVFLTSEVQPKLTTLYAANILNLDPLLRWYRFYKQIRNSKTHHGGIARQENVDAYALAIATPLKSLGLKRDYSSPVPVIGQEIKIALSDAVLMLAIIQRIAYAFDSKYCHTVLAETDLELRINKILLTIKPPKEALAARKETWIRNFMERHGAVTPTTIAPTEKWLRDKNLIDIRTI